MADPHGVDPHGVDPHGAGPDGGDEVRGHEDSFASTQEQRLARAVADTAPHAAHLLTEHLTRHHELLPILYLDALGVWYLAAWRGRDAHPDQFAQASAAAGVLDTAFTAEPSLHNAIAVGFLEMFTYLPEPEQTTVAATLPPALYTEYTAMAAWRP
jgi:hypothetical protein